MCLLLTNWPCSLVTFDYNKQLDQCLFLQTNLYHLKKKIHLIGHLSWLTSIQEVQYNTWFVEWWCHFNALVFLSDSLNVHPTGIVSEWKKTQCMPREVCLDVGKEFGAATNTFYKPPCVSVYRCGGCCNSEAHQCMNISTSYISKTVSCTQPGGPQEGGVGVWVRVCVSVRMCVG